MNTHLSDPHASRRLETAQLAIAIMKTQGQIKAAQVVLTNLHRKLAAQEAEHRFQSLMLRFPFAEKVKK